VSEQLAQSCTRKGVRREWNLRPIDPNYYTTLPCQYRCPRGKLHWLSLPLSGYHRTSTTHVAPTISRGSLVKAPYCHVATVGSSPALTRATGDDARNASGQSCTLAPDKWRFSVAVTCWSRSTQNRFRTGQGHCSACHKKWVFTDNELCDCGDIQTMSQLSSTLVHWPNLTAVYCAYMKQMRLPSTGWQHMALSTR